MKRLVGMKTSASRNIEELIRRGANVLFGESV